MRQVFEIVNPKIRRGGFRVVVFDFDGTLSLLREGWARIMAELGRDLILDAQLTLDSEPDLLAFLEREMLLLSGKPSIFQMRRLSEEVAQRGGAAPNPDAMLQEFLHRLSSKIQSRITAIQSGYAKPADWTVPGTHQLLDSLQDQGVLLVLASGTDRAFVDHDLQLLDLARYFGDRVFAPVNNSPNFHKRDVIAHVLDNSGLAGDQLLGFGDGYSETVEVKRLGGIAIGVASCEPGTGHLNAMKREMLIGLGADAIIPDYTGQDELFQWLVGGSTLN